MARATTRAQVVTQYTTMRQHCPSSLAITYTTQMPMTKCCNQREADTPPCEFSCSQSMHHLRLHKTSQASHWQLQSALPHAGLLESCLLMLWLHYTGLSQEPLLQWCHVQALTEDYANWRQSCRRNEVADSASVMPQASMRRLRASAICLNLQRATNKLTTALFALTSD